MSPLLGYSGRPDHNPVRFLDAVCLGYLLWWIPRAVDVAAMKLRFFQFLNLLGGHSLQAFAFSMLVTLFAGNIIKGFSPGAQIIWSMITVLSLALPAWLHQTFRKSRVHRNDPARVQPRLSLSTSPAATAE
jgi:hypothetical protein